MNINFNFPAITFPSFVTENEFVSLALREKKIIAIAAVALASIIFCVSLIRSAFFKGKSVLVSPSSGERLAPSSIVQGSGKIYSLDSPLSAKEIKIKELLGLIDSTPLIASNYLMLGELIEDNESIQLFDGTEVDRQKLCLKAIESDPRYAKAYFNLATTLIGEESIKLTNGAIVNSIGLYLKVIELDPGDIAPYKEIIRALKPGEAVQSDSGKTPSKQQICLKIIELEPSYARGYYALASTLQLDEKICLSNGALVGKEDLYFKTIELDSTYEGVAYGKLGALLKEKGVLVMPNGKSVTREEFEKFSIDFLRQNSPANYYHQAK